MQKSYVFGKYTGFSSHGCLYLKNKIIMTAHGIACKLLSSYSTFQCPDKSSISLISQQVHDYNFQFILPPYCIESALMVSFLNALQILGFKAFLFYLMLIQRYYFHRKANVDIIFCASNLKNIVSSRGDNYHIYIYLKSSPK